MRRSQQRPRRAARHPNGAVPLLVAGVLAVATACGTTVPLTAEGALGEAATAGGPADGLTAPGAAGPQPGAGQDVGTAVGPVGQGSSSSSASVAPGVTGATRGAGSGADDPDSRPASDEGDVELRGVTRTTVRIGIGAADDSGAFISALGLEGLDGGDYRAQVTAVLNDVNRRGGFAGRKVELVVHNFNTAQVLNDPDGANQAACAHWTEDGKVFAVVLPQVINELLLECLAKRNTPLIGSGGIEWPKIYEPTYAKYPNFFYVGTIAGSRFDKLQINRAVARGFFTPWDTTRGAPGTAPARIGLIGYDSPWGQLQIRSIREQLARHGLKLETVVLCPPDFNGAASCHQSSALRFRSDGVTHLLGSGALFMQNAESQRYRPRYWIEGATRVQEDNAPAAQLAGAMAASVVPVMDVRADKDPGDPTPATTYCKKVMKDAGLSTAERTTLWSMQSICDAFFVTKAAADAAGVLSTEAFRAGFESLGSRVPSATTWTNHFGPGEHAGARGVRDVEFDSACPCFGYVSSRTYTDLE